MANLRSNFQAHPRIRLPTTLLPPMQQFHVIRAICRNPEIDKEDLYDQALSGIMHRNNARAFSVLREVVYKATSRTLLDDKSVAPGQPLFDIGLGNFDEDTCSIVDKFNHKYLNDKGNFALLTLLTFDAGDLDPAAIDKFREGEVGKAAYVSRRIRRDKVLGKQTQGWLKVLKSSDEPATMEAADLYVEYRYLHDGSFTDYMRSEELKGNVHTERYYRDWFRKFDKGLGFPRPGRGRPTNTPGQS